MCLIDGFIHGKCWRELMYFTGVLDDFMMLTHPVFVNGAKF